jgi:hypothetical protein
VLHKPFIRIDQLFSSNMQETTLQYNRQYCWKITYSTRIILGRDSSYMATLQFYRLPYNRDVIHWSVSSNIAGFKQCSKRKLYTTIFQHSAALYCSVVIAGYVSVCVQLYCVGFHSFTACFGLHGHLHAHMQGKTKITKESNTGTKYKSKTCRAWPRAKDSKAESF